LEKARQAERIIAERTTAQEKYDRYQQAVAVSAEIATLATTHPSPNPLPVIKTAVERLRKLDGHIRELKAALADEVEVTFDVAPEPTWQPLSRWSIALVAIGLLIALGPVVAEALGLFKTGVIIQLLGAIVAIVGLALAFVAWWLRRSARTHAQMRDVEIDRRLRGRSQMEAELKVTEADVERQLGAIGLPTIAEAEDLLAREEAHVGQMGLLAAQLEGLVGKVPTETLPELRDAAAHEVEQKTSALNALGPIAK
jgi:hypothetical protein